MLDYISRQIVQLDITRQLPDIRTSIAPLMNRATDVLSAAFCYLDVRICREAHRFGIFGKISSKVF